MLNKYYFVYLNTCVETCEKMSSFSSTIAKIALLSLLLNKYFFLSLCFANDWLSYSFQSASDQPQTKGVSQRNARDWKCGTHQRSGHLHLRRQKLAGIQRQRQPRTASYGYVVVGLSTSILKLNWRKLNIECFIKKLDIEISSSLIICNKVNLNKSNLTSKAAITHLTHTQHEHTIIYVSVYYWDLFMILNIIKPTIKNVTQAQM